MESSNKSTGQAVPKNEYQPNWAFYFSNVDNKLGSIATDLNLASVAPIKGQGNVVYLSIKMPNPMENGLSSEGDAEELWAIEDSVLNGFDKNNLNYTFAGRLTSDGIRSLYFFGENTILMEKEVSSAMATYPSYEFNFGHSEDVEWSGYFDFLYPLPEQLQVIKNTRILDHLSNAGDQLTKEREVFHWVYFKTEEELNQFEKFTNELGFTTKNKSKTEPQSEFCYVIQISRVDMVSYREINECTLTLWRKASELNGEYDGWETSVEK